MRLAMLRCAGCGKGPKELYLHHGKLFCALCLLPDEGDNLETMIHITSIRARELREQARRLREK